MKGTARAASGTTPSSFRGHVPRSQKAQKPKPVIWTEVRGILRECPNDWSLLADAFARFGCPGSLQTDHPPSSSGYLVDASRRTVSALSQELERLGCSAVHVRNVEQEDWAQVWKRFFKPRRVGKLLLRPTWEDCKVKPHEIEIVLDPGQAFGTGDHPTTRLCLELLQRVDLRCKSVLDVGCGSGILSIAAKKLAASRVLAVDIEQLSVDVTLCNVRLNRVEVEALCCDGFQSPCTEGPWDVIFGNLISATLMRFAPSIPALLMTGGRWIVSGILESNWPDVRKAAEDSGLILGEMLVEDDWVGALFRK